MSSKWSKLSAVDIQPGVEIKHGGISYLQWAYCCSKLCESYPDSTYGRHEIECMHD